MFNRLRQLFWRYAATHLKVQILGFELRDETGNRTGYLEAVEARHRRLYVEGWVVADRIALIAGAKSIEACPALARPDVIKSGYGDGAANGGFRLDLPYEPGADAVALCVRAGQTRYVYPLSLSSSRRLNARRLWLLVPFLAALLRTIPSILHWRLTGDLAARQRIKTLLGLTDIPSGMSLLPPQMFRDPAAPSPDTGTAITLILPVYNAFELLPEVLDRIVRHTDLPWHLILIEDRSTDDRVRLFLRDWTAAREAEEPDRITLIENSENQGFIQSVNRGFDIARDRGHHVVLINSDAFVPATWASRLLGPILARTKVASVTPMSNDAEILSVPAIGRRSDIKPGLVDLIDSVAARLNPETSLAELPTGVGFCMAINIDYLRLVPQFDPAFGRGYGEEVDWCQKVRARGGRHLGTAALFVEHRGGASFGSTEKLAMVARNNAVISERYPGYDAEVQAFIRDDPLTAQRLALALAAESQKDPVPVYLAHSLGGGAEKYLQQRIDEAATAGQASVVLRVGGAWRWQIELHQDGETRIAATDDFSQIEALLAPIPARRIVYSCGVGAPDPAELPARLLSLKRGDRDRVEILFHDFYPLSPSYTLLNGAGLFAGVPDAENPDPAHRLRRSGGGYMSLADWRDAWRPLVTAADKLVVFSRDSGDHVLAAYPEAEKALELRPHRMLAEVPRVTPEPSERRVIGVLGNIGYQKGAAVVVDMARALERQGRDRLVLIGDIDPDFSLPASAHLHGHYEIENIPSLVARYGITDWLIPSIWPETFSFTAHEALATGMPVWCFDLGAQAEAARAAANGHVIPLTAEENPAQVALTHITETKREPA